MSNAWNDDLLRNPHQVADKRSRVQKMFAAIAPSYDLNNRLHSLWMDQRWRRKAVRLADIKAADSVVDVACGTGDLAIKFVEALFRLHGKKIDRTFDQPSVSIPGDGPAPKTVLGIDFTFEMLPIAKAKTPRVHTFGVDNGRLWDGWYDAISWLNGDALSLPLPDACCDVLSIAFGIRNVSDPAAAMREFHRVLRPAGRLIILEFSLPTNALLRSLYNFYFRQILPRTATLISRDKTGAYKYLPESVNTFISREQMMTMMTQAGFQSVEQHPLTFGICVCYRGIK